MLHLQDLKASAAMYSEQVSMKYHLRESIFMRQNFAIVFFATILFLLTNGFYLVKNIALNTMLALDMVPLYMMTAASLAMLIFVRVNKKYDSPLSRFALLVILYGFSLQALPFLWFPAIFTKSIFRFRCAICL